jgi:hypothetical protein
MSFKFRLMFAVTTFGALWCQSGGASEIDIFADAEAIFAKHGYELSEESMRRALNDRDSSVVFQCLLQIEKQQYTGLVPEVQAYLNYVESENVYDKGSRFAFTRCLLSIEESMNEEVLEAHLREIRAVLYKSDKRGDDGYIYPIHAFYALLAAQEFWDVDIYDDLLYLSCTDIIRGSLDYPAHTAELFQLYGDRVSESDIDMILAAWPERPKRREFALRRAREHGKRLELDPQPGG